jgi:hypothetical protein
VPWGRHIRRRASQWGSSGGNSYLKECTGDLINLHTNLLIIYTQVLLAYTHNFT